MVHSLAPSTAAAAVPISTSSTQKYAADLPSLGFHRIWASHSDQPQQCCKLVHRRTSALGLAGLALGLNVGGGDWSASAASRRAPPPPPEEKKDPGMNAITAKVLASKKRKEALKDAIAKLKEQGKAITKSSE